MTDLTNNTVHDEREWTLTPTGHPPNDLSIYVTPDEGLRPIRDENGQLEWWESEVVVPKSVLVAERQQHEQERQTVGERFLAERQAREEAECINDILEADCDRYRKVLEIIEGRAYASREGNFRSAIIAIEEKARAALYPDQEGGSDE